MKKIFLQLAGIAGVVGVLLGSVNNDALASTAHHHHTHTHHHHHSHSHSHHHHK